MSVPFGTANSMPHPELERLAGELAKHIKSEQGHRGLEPAVAEADVESALKAELDEHLGYERHTPAGRGRRQKPQRLFEQKAQGRFGLPKFRVNVANAVSAEPPLAVRAIFFLRRGRTVGPRISRLSPMQAIKPYLKASFLLALSKATRSRVAFAQAVKLASAIPAFELRYLQSPKHFSSLLDSLTRSSGP